jgi:hypothetical protein
MASLSNENQKTVTRSWLLEQLLILLLMLFFTLAVVEVLARVIVVGTRPPMSHFQAFDKKYALAQSIGASTTPTIIILGSSHATTGFYPELMEEKLATYHLNVSIVNLGVSANTPDHSLFLLKTLIQSGTKPRLVLADVSPPWMFNAAYYQDPSSTAYKFQRSYLGQCIAQVPETLQQKIACQVAHYSYLVRHQHYFKDLLKTLPEMVLHTHRQFDYQPITEAQIETSPKGWSPLYPVVTRDVLFQNSELRGPERTARMQMLEPLYGHFKWDAAPMYRLIYFCHQRHIPLLLIWLPEHPIQATFYHAFHLDESAIEKRLNALFIGPSVWYIDAHKQRYPDDLFQNPDHFNVVGAIEFSNWVAVQLAQEPFRQYLETSKSHPQHKYDSDSLQKSS